MYFNDSDDKRIQIFEDTMKQCQNNKKLSDAVKKSVAGTKIYMPENYADIRKRISEDDGKITVTKERTFKAAAKLHKLYPECRIGVLNFASATHVGGGVTKGFPAQEQDLCRCSTLYPCLNINSLLQDFYRMHRNKNDLRYTDTCIYTPDVIVIKSDTAFPESVPEKEWFSVDVLTCPAPNLGNAELIHLSDRELLEIHIKRGQHILNIAAANNIDAFVLGAFGCGVFRNNPDIVAHAYSKIISDYRKYFREIRFAVYCSPNNTKNYDIFNRALGNL